MLLDAVRERPCPTLLGGIVPATPIVADTGLAMPVLTTDGGGLGLA